MESPLRIAVVRTIWGRGLGGGAYTGLIKIAWSLGIGENLD